eukprot:TRINITY_DN1619_c0_g1_i2.p1 TRINITY_DN1619_c0_g1~~TRINITY_DN1619_c0_g1_i2.p1  ORF type:complete len:143 (-),score=10.62 TRINITY_DN1619_c0_g1_i2:159-587(-)
MRKNILITGASSGLGKGMAKEFAKQGCNLALCARRFELLEQLKSELEQINPNITISIKVLDVNDHEQVFSVFNAFKDELNGLDRVIINAGMGKGASIGTGYFNANKQTAQTNFSRPHLRKLKPQWKFLETQNHRSLSDYFIY